MENHLDFMEFTWENRLIDRSILSKWMLRCRGTFVICTYSFWIQCGLFCLLHLIFPFCVSLFGPSSSYPHISSVKLWADWCFCLSKMSVSSSPSLFSLCVCVWVWFLCVNRFPWDWHNFLYCVCVLVCLLTIEYKGGKKWERAFVRSHQTDTMEIRKSTTEWNECLCVQIHKCQTTNLIFVVP